MGMYDDIKVMYPLPGNPGVFESQTKSFPDPYLVNYELREDGTLWREEFEHYDARTEEEKAARSFAGCMARRNHHWVQLKDFTGEIEVWADDNEYSIYLQHGKVVAVTIVNEQEGRGD